MCLLIRLCLAFRARSNLLTFPSVYFCVWHGRQVFKAMSGLSHALTKAEREEKQVWSKGLLPVQIITCFKFAPDSCSVTDSESRVCHRSQLVLSTQARADGWVYGC
jgi:hypothetical protein